MTDSVEMKADVNVEFDEASSRQQINSGESVKTLFGKIRKFLTDLKAVAFSGSYDDLIDKPDLSAYAKKTDVPNIKVNAAVDADTVGGFKANQFVLGSAVVQLTTSINEYYTVGTVSVEEQYTPDFPVGYGSFGLLDVRTYGSIVYQTIRFENGKIIHRARVLGATDWTEWAEIYTSGNKPYITGSFSGTSFSNDNFDFKPSFAICNDNGTIKHGNIYQMSDVFRVSFENLSDTTHQYMIFK